MALKLGSHYYEVDLKFSPAGFETVLFQTTFFSLISHANKNLFPKLGIIMISALLQARPGGL
jgi:hypothetical protein